MTNLAARHKQVSACINQQEEEPKVSLKPQQYHARSYDICSKVTSSLSIFLHQPLLEQPSAGLQELAATRVSQLWLLIYRLKRRPPAQAGGGAAGGRRQQRPGEALSPLLSL